MKELDDLLEDHFHLNEIRVMDRPPLKLLASKVWRRATEIERQNHIESRKPELFGVQIHDDFIKMVKELYNPDRLIRQKHEPHGKISPNELEILIHYHRNPTPHPRIASIAVGQAVERFLALGVMVPAEASSIKLTDKGKAWLHCILSTPFPKKVWLDDNGRIIDEALEE